MKLADRHPGGEAGKRIRTAGNPAHFGPGPPAPLLSFLLPQFLDPTADFLTQMVVFEVTFLTLAFANAFGYALVASRARLMVKDERAVRAVNRVGGSLLIGAGVAAITIRGSQG